MESGWKPTVPISPMRSMPRALSAVPPPFGVRLVNMAFAWAILFRRDDQNHCNWDDGHGRGRCPDRVFEAPRCRRDLGYQSKAGRRVAPKIARTHPRGFLRSGTHRRT